MGSQPTVQTVPAAQPPNTKKRPLDSISHIQNSQYYKMRAVLRDLRPQFIEVLRTPDFVNCKPAHEIREKMGLLMDLYKEMTAGTTNQENDKNVPEGKALSGEIQDGQMPKEQHQDAKPAEKPQPDRVFSKSSEDKPLLGGNIPEKLRSEDGRIQGSYIVGGSAFGWNFITFPGSKAVYYGRTKDSFRSANKMSS